ncbi:hypothetical protein CJ030_MR1G005820 [Morella rubra]|uniref:Uncharacterized protein n=1 Tax=Morella rubra TaxID=262757 RepID=A0A6A1WP15_9ROSI|nr:hypothetical protein CJ030_MR1G005820 [Morella rubra]
MNLSYNRFSGQVLAEIEELLELEYLRLDSNKLYGTQPLRLSQSVRSSLIHLSAQDNALTGLIPVTIGAIPNLQVLSLSRNEFSGSVPTSMLCHVVSANYSFSHRIVQLGFNAFTGVVKPPNGKRVGMSEEMEYNYLDSKSTKEHHREQKPDGNNNEGNRLSGSIPAFLGGLKTLKLFSLGRNLFSGSMPIEFGRLSELEMLNLSNNNLTVNVPEEIMCLSNFFDEAVTNKSSAHRESKTVRTNLESKTGCHFVI